ncbi:MAG: glycosyltransferase, partial [Candidatus Bathyarchaeota archaeon]
MKKGTIDNENLADEGELPSFSIIVPMKDEAKVARRILGCLLRLSYPLEKLKILVVDDCSVDGTSGICKEFSTNYPEQVKCLRTSFSEGKSAAL